MRVRTAAGVALTASRTEAAAAEEAAVFFKKKREGKNVPHAKKENNFVSLVGPQARSEFSNVP